MIPVGNLYVSALYFTGIQLEILLLLLSLRLKHMFNVHFNTFFEHVVIHFLFIVV